MPENIINSFDRENNFWEMNPQFKAIEPFKSFYEKDKTKKKWKSSTAMWAIAFLKDPDSILYNMPEEARKEAILNDYVEDGNFSFENHKELVTRFEEMCTTQAERSLQDFYKKLKERTDFLNNQHYSLELISEKSTKTQAQLLDEMMAQTHKLFQTYQNIKDDIKEEKEQAEIGRGGAQQSMSDAGEI